MHSPLPLSTHSVAVVDCIDAGDVISLKPHQGRLGMSSVPTCSSYCPADNPATMAHVNLLQGIINRLANNSTSCKTWCLALVSALIGLAGASKSLGIASYALLPVLLFGCLDAMYL